MGVPCKGPILYHVQKCLRAYAGEADFFVYSTVCIILAVILRSAAFDLVPGVLWRLCMPCVNCSKCLSKKTSRFLSFVGCLGFDLLGDFVRDCG